jgi:hypothetical protein
MHGPSHATTVNSVFWPFMLRSYKWEDLLDKSSVSEERAFLNDVKRFSLG